MPEQQDLRQMLQQLHAELQRAHAIDDRSRALLRSALNDIEHLLERAKEPGKRSTSLTERLREAVGGFEATPPTLTGMVGGVAGALAEMGI